MAFGSAGITAILKGDANDSLCKGLSGAKVAVMPDTAERSHPSGRVVCGNTALYGATSGRLFVRGFAGERFAVRNSGAHAVVEGVGDHGCEYMTGGSVVVLGPVGRNFAAGMSGGLAFIYDPREESRLHINKQLVDVESCTRDEDSEFLKAQLTDHLRLTGSSVCEHILNHWETEKKNFIRIIPHGFKPSMIINRTPPPHPTTKLNLLNHEGIQGATESFGGRHG
jgi:glutamate synthase domain-containing protein 3